MEDLCFKIDVVLNECCKFLLEMEKIENYEHESFYKSEFKKFINGPLLQFVKSIQAFLKIFKCMNMCILYVCLSQIRKCLLMYETAMSKQNTVLNFEKILTLYIIKRIQKCFYKLEDYLEMSELTNLDEQPGIFIDLINIVLNGLNNRDNFEIIEPNIDKILFQAITIAKVSDEEDYLEITSSSKHVIKLMQSFKNMNINKTDSFFQYDCLASSLSILERRINTTALHLISKVFNDPFCIIKKLIRKCRYSVDIQLRDSSDLSSLISDLDKSTDTLIQIGLFSVACCKNKDYAIPLKCCISSLELLDSDIVPALIAFYLDPTSMEKKSILKLLINHWVCEICEVQNLLDKIIDPFAYIQITIETSMNFIDTIFKSDKITSIDLYIYLLNELTNCSKYIDKIFAIEILKENELSTTYKQFNAALEEYKACLIFNQKTNIIYNHESAKTKLLKRCKIVIKYLKNIQMSICNIMDNKSISELENTCYVLSKIKQSPTSLFQNENLDDDNALNLIFSTIQVQKSFYNKSKQKTSKRCFHQDYLPAVNETFHGVTVTMDLTNILDNFIETLNNTPKINLLDIWEEIDIDTPTRTQDFEDVNNKIKSCNMCD